MINFTNTIFSPILGNGLNTVELKYNKLISSKPRKLKEARTLKEKITIEREWHTEVKNLFKAIKVLNNGLNRL